MVRFGIGYDVHRLVEGRKLILGNVEIDHHLGLLGHSDADVLIHAIIDAMLGAAGLGDIGQHFPDSDQKYKDINSAKLLISAKNLLDEQGYQIGNIDTIIIAQKPKLSPYIKKIRQRLAEILNIDEKFINVKAKTEEGLGFTGNEEGIAAYAVVSIEN